MKITMVKYWLIPGFIFVAIAYIFTKIARRRRSIRHRNRPIIQNRQSELEDHLTSQLRNSRSYNSRSHNAENRSTRANSSDNDDLIIFGGGLMDSDTSSYSSSSDSSSDFGGFGGGDFDGGGAGGDW